MATAATRRPRQINNTKRARHKEGTQKPELLRNDGEDEVSVVGRKKMQRALGAAPDALAEKPSRADGDDGLDHVPASTVSIGVGVQKRPKCV